MFSILIVDDEQPILDVCQRYLKKEGFTVFTASNGQEAELIVLNNHLDFIIIDILMPKMNGYELVESLHAKGFNIPFLYLTALNQEKDKLYGLTLGADDYITKPFSPRELILRIKNIITRTKKLEVRPVTRLKEGSLYLNQEERIAKIQQNILDLTIKEFDLLWFLVQEKHRIISKSELLKKVWGYDYYEDANTVNVHVHHLREKLATHAHGEQIIIKTIWGIGYQFQGDSHL